GRIRQARTRLIAVSAAAVHATVATLPKLAMMPPIIGPTMNPIPTDAPTLPIARARSAGGVESAKYACATLIVAPEPPSSNRDSSSNHQFPATANSAYDAALPARPSISTGRRPKRSLTRTQNGEQELDRRIGTDDHADEGRVEAERGCVAGEDRQQHPEADDVDEHREQDNQRGRARSRHSGGEDHPSPRFRSSIRRKLVRAQRSPAGVDAALSM